MPLEHVGLGVPDVDVAKATSTSSCQWSASSLALATDTARRTTKAHSSSYTRQVNYSRHQVGLHHLAFLVSTRADVQRVYEWARDRGDEIVRAPKPFPRYGPHCYATFYLDSHGFMIEIVSHESVISN
jgi:catechol 2,3-dioxygenase-like lactoylglutathione lyase family enzyme